MENLLSSILNIHTDMHICKAYSLSELLKNNKLKSLSEIGFRFNSKYISDIVNNLNYRNI